MDTQQSQRGKSERNNCGRHWQLWSIYWYLTYPDPAYQDQEDVDTQNAKPSCLHALFSENRLHHHKQLYPILESQAETIQHQGLGLPVSHPNRSHRQFMLAFPYTLIRAHETPEYLVCCLLLEKKNTLFSSFFTTPHLLFSLSYSHFFAPSLWPFLLLPFPFLIISPLSLLFICFHFSILSHTL